MKDRETSKPEQTIKSDILDVFDADWKVFIKILNLLTQASASTLQCLNA